MAHNGPGPRSLNRDLFLMMCGETPDLTSTDISPILAEHGEKFAELKRCTGAKDVERVKEVLSDWVADCGVPTVYSATAEDLPMVLYQVTAHFSFHRVSSMILQYQQGMNSCGGMWTLVSQNCREFMPVFTNTWEKLTRTTIRAMFRPEMSEEMTRRREEEEDTIYWFEKWLVDIEEGKTEVTFEDLLVFVTGSDHVPSLGFPEEPSIEFYDQERGVRRLPYASTCSLTLYLPRGIDEEDQLEGIWRIVIHGGIDGYSSLIVFLGASDNNRSATVLDSFVGAVARNGVPSRVRTDRGGENNAVCLFMNIFRGLRRGSAIQGRSVHNQRIERLWADLWRGVSNVYHTLFHFLEGEGIVDPDNEGHIWALHYIYLPRLNRDLTLFMSQWNNHGLRTERHF
ncbi:G2/M phase-specific E3 ubiquitin-protein ligase-like [Odontesthes bonariensis]|uniref:G2/M phase-specific E3 ubiquitin-protein ligase-like n=1 Tax=Odontesthes bonariensis TaxID=219752 RepID=UPI003F58E01B